MTGKPPKETQKWPQFEKLPPLENMPQLLLALDMVDVDLAYETVARIKPLLDAGLALVKIGQSLQTAMLAATIRAKSKEAAADAGSKIWQIFEIIGDRFVWDAKNYDITYQVELTITQILEIGPRFFTIAGVGGKGPMKAAVRLALKYLNDKGRTSYPFEVTIPTGMPEEDCIIIHGKSSTTAVPTMATLGKESGVNNFVCGAPDLDAVIAIAGVDTFILVPGIRDEEVKIAGDDQQRIGNLEKVIKKGGRWVIIVKGRDFTQAENPFDAAKKFTARIAAAKTSG